MEGEIEKDLTKISYTSEIIGNNNNNADKLDSKYSWLQSITGLMVHFVLFGSIGSFGVYLGEYLRTDFKDQSPTILALIGSLGSALCALFSIPAGILVSKVNHRIVMLTGAFVFGFGLVLASFAQQDQVWLLFLGQSVFFAIGVSFCVIPAISIVTQWFDKHIGLGVGICGAGSGIGGLVISPIIQAINDKIGWRWALRVNGIFGILVLSIAAVILRPRVPFKAPRIFDIQILVDTKFIALWCQGAISCFAIWVPLFLMPLYCQYYGISATSASLMIGLMNGSAAVGRIAAGLVAKYIGNINTLFTNNLICSLTFPLIWYFSTTTWPLIIFSIIFGFLTSALFTNSALLMPEIFGLEKLAQVNGLFYTCSFPGSLAGTAIATSIISASTAGDYTNYLPCMMFLFVCYLGSCVFLAWLRFQISNSLITKV
jgi:MFS family permease